CVSFLNPSMPPFGIDWSSATARFSSRPLTPPFLLISFTARAAPERNWMPHGAKLAVSDVSTPTLIGAAALDPPYAVDPPNAAVSTARAPTAATNQNRFTDILLPRGPPMIRSRSRDRSVRDLRRPRADPSVGS